MYKLMIKSHKDTGLKYLCITMKEDHINYSGSGVYWKKHLKAHGNNISTEVLYSSSEYSDFVDVCCYYSDLFDVVNSSEWANLVPEAGYGRDGEPNVVLFWRVADEETKQSIIAERNKSIAEGHFSKKDGSEVIYDIISGKLKDRWEGLSIDTKQNILNRLWEGRQHFFEQRGCKYDQWRESISTTLKQYYATLDPERLSEKNKLARLNISAESAQSRKAKIQEVYKSGKHDSLFERYSRERVGENNPAAKAVEIQGVVYKTIKEAAEAHGITRSVLNTRLSSTKWPEWKRQ